ncbi:MAG: hypothetical protein FH748_08390 [Balneolaceae bacterium]|nr:hypothetical protein [Balneolaceae bacterium]
MDEYCLDATLKLIRSCRSVFQHHLRNSAVHLRASARKKETKKRLGDWFDSVISPGTDIEMAYFLDDLNRTESLTIQQSMNAFELKVLRNKEFRNSLAKKFQ